MSKLTAVVAALSLVAATGCTTSVCKEFDDASASLRTKADPCAALGGAFTPTEVTDAQVTACENNQSTACTDADRTAAADYADCVAALSNCSVATALQWTADYASCAIKLQPISNTCSAMFQ